MMNWSRLVVATVLLSSSALPFTAGAANASRPRVTNAPVYEPVLPVVLPSAPVPTFVPVLPQEHSFELFNNSQQDILYLHLAPLTDPDNVTVYGGSRSLSSGRAWRVSLDGECDYSLFVEYEDGSQSFYDRVNTCDYRGIQLR